MTTISALLSSATPVAGCSRGRPIPVTALYPAHPYGRVYPNVVTPSKMRSNAISTGIPDPKLQQGAAEKNITFHGVHHVGVLVKDLDISLQFYCGILGLEINPNRPADKLPYGGAWLWIGSEMIHLMALPNPDPLEGRPSHGGRDRHSCVGVASLLPLEERLAEAGIPFTRSNSGRPAIFFRDPDMNGLEVVETEPWR